MQRDTSQLSGSEYDLVIIGGGIYGACVAWDAAQRGLSVALIERGDFGQETSANSLKTVHGGLRYLQDLDLRLVRMMIEERSAYLRIAPHLVQPLPCITPTYSKLMKSKAAMGFALRFNDLAGYDRNKHLEPDQKIPPSRLVSPEECRKILPGLPQKAITGGAVWYDGQVYDTERLTLSIVISAHNAGAVICNYVEAFELLQHEDKILGVLARDAISGEEYEVHSKVVINAAGPWINQLSEGFDRDITHSESNNSLAINIITREIIEGYAAGVPSWPGVKSKDGANSQTSHMLFISPWRNLSIIGTFHTHYQGNPDDFSIEGYDLERIIQEANSAYPGANLELEDIKFVHYGFLPEHTEDNNPEVKLVRKSRIIDHRREDSLSGLITVLGVKYTTARHAAEEAVDLVFDQLGIEPPACSTQSTAINGGQIGELGEFLVNAYQEDEHLLSQNAIDHWVRNYGTCYSQVKNLLPKAAHRSPLALHSKPVVSAQVVYAAREEMAIKLSDVILRRTGIGSIGQPDNTTLDTAAEIMAAEMGWSIDQTELEIEETKSIYRKHGSHNQMAAKLEIS
jgi:glycerol-3-phosphate dehydrogenase